MRARAIMVLAATFLVAGCGAENRSDQLLVTNWGSSDVSALRLDAEGAIVGKAKVGKPAKGNLQGSVRSPGNRWLYVANWGAGNLTAYRLNKLNDPVTVKANPPAVRPSSVVLSPDGKHLYLANDTDGKEATISYFALDPDGKPHEGTTIPSHGAGTNSVATNGETLLASSPSSCTISTFKLTDGVPTFVQTITSGKGTFFTAIAYDGQVVATNAAENTLSLFRLAPDSTLKLITKVASGAQEPRGIAVNRDGTRAYVANFNGGSGPGAVTTFEIGHNTLKQFGMPAPTGSAGAEGIALSKDGKSLYVANFNDGGSGSVASYRIDDHGTLGPLRGPVPTDGRQPDLTSITVPN